MTHRLIVALVLIVALAACTPTAAESTLTSTDEPTESPTDTPEPTATDEPTATPTATLTPTTTSTPSPTRGPGLDDLLETPGAMYLNAELNAAAAAYNDLIDLYPNSADLYIGLAEIALRQGEPNIAMTRLYEATIADPGNLEAWRLLSVLLDQAGRYEDLAAAYTAMLGITPDDPDLYVARAMALARNDQPDQAIDDLAQAQSLDSYREFAYLNVSGAAFGARSYQAAIDIATAGLDAYPESTGLYLTRGRAQLALNAPEAALSDFITGLDVAPGNVSLLRWQGESLDLLGRPDEAIVALQQAGERGADVGTLGADEAYEAMARAAQIISRSDRDAAFRYLAGEVITYGQSPPLLMGYALIDMENDQLTTAKSRLSGLIDLYDYLPAYYYRAQIWIAEGDTERAKADLQYYISVRQAGPFVEVAYDLLEQID